MIIIKKEFAGSQTITTRRVFFITNDGLSKLFIVTPACNKCNIEELVSCLHLTILKK
jgi:hypothetical protein